MYDAFISGSEQPDDTPYTVRSPTYNIAQKNTAAAADAKLSDELPWSRLDAVPQEISDQILWASVHGASAPAPPPGPNASLGEHERAVIVRELLRQSPAAFQSTYTRGKVNCPITWACRPAPPGDG